MFDLILQNTASKQEYLIQGLTDTSDSWLVYVFENFQMPEGAEEGEYYGALYRNFRKDCEYELNDVITETLIHTNEGDVRVRDLRPELFLMKFGDVVSQSKFREENKNYYYYKH